MKSLPVLCAIGKFVLDDAQTIEIFAHASNVDTWVSNYNEIILNSNLKSNMDIEMNHN